MCVNETYSRFRVGKHLSDKLPFKNGLKQGGTLSPSLFNLLSSMPLGGSTNPDDLKLDGTHQFLVYTDDVNILGGGTHPREKNTEAVVVASKESGLEVNADKT